MHLDNSDVCTAFVGRVRAIANDARVTVSLI